MELIEQLAKELNVRQNQVKAAVDLIDEGNTIPFIARYRKEATGSLDDTVLRDLFDRLTYLRNLEKRKGEILASIDEQGKLTDELRTAVQAAATLAEAEDLYRPYKPKRRTRASIARERGLEPLAQFLLAQQPGCAAPEKEAEQYVDGEKGVPTAEDALAGARDILAETVSDDAAVRKRLRELFLREGVIQSSGATQEDTVYAQYYEYSEPVARIPGHRILALDRGEREDKLKVSVVVDQERALARILPGYVKTGSPCTAQVEEACRDAYSRLIYPSLVNEVRGTLTERADEQAIGVFAVNLKNLLMQPPVKGRVVLGLDPAYRTGCKIAVIDSTGKVLDTTVVYPTPPQKKIEEAKSVLKRLILKHGVSVIAIGNGTASRESEQFVAELIRELEAQVAYMIVSEAGASVYSASKLAAEEFPEYDVSLRSAVSIARRLQDPLAELVKIDPKAIGVGQYQHDMPKARLDSALGGVVEASVNQVGVDLNTASHSLLSYVAGINGTVAKNIVAYREENGGFRKRSQLLKVAKLGKKAYEQCAGFLRIPESENPLDRTAVHPESYEAALRLLELCGHTAQDVSQGKAGDLKEKAQAMGLSKLAQELGIGVPTLNDMLEELLKPGRDPRDQLPPPILRTDVLEMKDLKPGMELTGTVRNVIDFGAFVDIGVHEDGLVHISQLSDRYVKHPSEVVKVGDIVKVRVLEVDMKRKRISLTMKKG